MKVKDIEARLKIDQDDLDEELIAQPQLVYEVARKHSLAVSVREAARDSIKKVAAGIGARFRVESEEKVTEKAVTEYVEQHPKHEDAKEVHREKAATADRWQALRDAVHSRGFILRDLVSLEVSVHHSTGIGAYEERKQEMHRKRKGIEGGRTRL